MVGCWFGGYNRQCSGVTPNSALRGIIWGARKQTQAGLMEGKRPPNRLFLWTHQNSIFNLIFSMWFPFWPICKWEVCCLNYNPNWKYYSFLFWTDLYIYSFIVIDHDIYDCNVFLKATIMPYIWILGYCRARIECS